MAIKAKHGAIYHDTTKKAFVFFVMYDDDDRRSKRV